MTRGASKSALDEFARNIAEGPLVALVPYDQSKAQEWDAFVETSRNGTLFHARRFLSYHPPERFVDRSMLIYRNDRLIAVFPGAEQLRDGSKWWSSYPGSTYGGLVLADGTMLEDTVAALHALAARAREDGFAGIEMRLSEQAFRRRPSDDLEFGLWWLGFEQRAVELSTSIPVFQGFELAQRAYREDTRRNVRKASKGGVRVAWSDDFATYWAILTQNLVKHGAHPTHTLEEILRLRDLCGDRIKLAVAEVGGVMAAGVVVFVANQTCYHSFYIAQNYEYQQSRALSAVIDFLVRWGADESFRYFNLGISTEGAGTMVNWGLFTFKQGFGGAGYARASYRLTLER